LFFVPIRGSSMMHRFFVTPDSIVNKTVHFGEVQARQIRHVLRLQPGAEVVVLDNSGREYGVTLTEVTQLRVLGRIEEQRPSTGEPRTRLTLYQSLLPRDKFEWVLQKGTEVGVSVFVPVITQRSLVRDAGTIANKRARWERIVLEAAEQSGRGRLPELRLPVPFAEALSQASSSHCTLIPWEKAAKGSIGAALGRLPGDLNQPAVALFVGPEGGFSDEEIEQASAAAAIPVTLGRRILRTETAAVVAAALVLYELGDLGEGATR
jgi:16S rRNA (uracil1498-N3)-methyltransferase